MAAQEFVTASMALKPMLTSIRLSREANVADASLPKVNVATKDLSSTRHKDIAEGMLARYHGNHQRAKQMAEHYRVSFSQGSGDYDFWERVSAHIDEMKMQGGQAADCRAGSRGPSGSTAMRFSLSTAHSAITGGGAKALEAHSSQPAMANPGPMLSPVPITRRSSAWWRGFTLLTMLLSRRSRRDRSRWQGPTLPPGCVMVVRYRSR